MGGTSFALQTISATHPAYPMLDVAVRSSERAAHLVQQLLAYAGKGRFFLETVNLSHLLQETSDLLHASIPKSVTLELRCDAAVPSIEANSGQLQQLIMNLMINGIEAMSKVPEDQRQLVIEAQSHVSEDKSFVLITVTDSGIGLKAEDLPRVFEIIPQPPRLLAKNPLGYLRYQRVLGATLRDWEEKRQNKK